MVERAYEICEAYSKEDAPASLYQQQQGDGEGHPAAAGTGAGAGGGWAPLGGSHGSLTAALCAPSPPALAAPLAAGHAGACGGGGCRCAALAMSWQNRRLWATAGKSYEEWVCAVAAAMVRVSLRPATLHAHPGLTKSPSVTLFL